jgi:hypothetical protein
VRQTRGGQQFAHEELVQVVHEAFRSGHGRPSAFCVILSLAAPTRMTALEHARLPSVV